MIRNQSNKLYLEFLVNSGVNFFTQNQPNFFYYKDNAAKIDIKNNIQDIKSIEELKNFIMNSNSCSLKNSAKKTVVGDGNLNAKLMIIGEAPGKDEDEQGKPFIGQAGQLLNNMLKAINIERKEVYITNVIPWRPPNNRAPNSEEILQCLPFLQKHIEIINPDLLLLLGLTAAKAVLSSTLTISRLRSVWHNYKSINLNKSIDVLVSYHPAFLLRSPNFKKEAWDDLKLLKEKINHNEI